MEERQSGGDVQLGQPDVEITVACCLWGDWPEKGWGPEYVARLQRGVERNLSVPHRFVCFADDVERVPEGIEARPLNAPSWKGCLPKLYVYTPEAGLEGRVLLLDLDNVITGSLDKMAAYRGPLAVRAWFGGYPRQRVADGDMIGFEAGSETANKIWREFAANPRDTEKWTGGRERYYLREFNPELWQDVLGVQSILSYKRHLKDKRPPDETCIVSFHDGSKDGNTQRPHQVDRDWLKEVWQ